MSCTSGFVDDAIFHIVSYVVRGVGNNDVGAMLNQVDSIYYAFSRGRHAV